MPLTQPDRLFIEQRRARRSFGLYILPLVLLVLMAVWAAMFFWWPLAVNPKAVWGAQETGILNCGSGTLSTYATGATVMTNVMFALLGAIIVLRIAWSSSERRYLKMLEKLEQEQVTHVPAGIAAPPTSAP
ncbi:MAG: hypothetical protein JWN48_3666 [Myxococcaceae bacterium]|nr:hypothetical protein [Myxococcaceae bacterium]